MCLVSMKVLICADWLMINLWGSQKAIKNLIERPHVNMLKWFKSHSTCRISSVLIGKHWTLYAPLYYRVSQGSNSWTHLFFIDATYIAMKIIYKSTQPLSQMHQDHMIL